EEITFESEDGEKFTETTDENGKITFDREDLPEGKYKVTDKDGNDLGEIDVEYSEDCEDNVKTVIVPEEKRKVCEEFTVEVEDHEGNTVTEEEITFESEDGEKFTETTDENGKITFDREDLPEGKYKVTDKDGNDLGEIDVEYSEDCEDNVKTVIVPEEKRKVCEEFTVEVEDHEGNTVTEEEITFESEDGEKFTETTDENGKITFDREDLPEGKYKVTDKDGNDLGEIDVEYSEDCEDNVKTVIVPEEERKVCEEFTVEVEDHEGNPVTEEEITFESEDGEKFTETTDENGKITFDREDLPGGKYKVTDKDGNDLGEIEVEYSEDCEDNVRKVVVPKENPKVCEEVEITVTEGGKPSKDKTYMLTSKDGKTTVTITTGNDGKAIVDGDDLPYGEYTVTDADGDVVGTVTIDDDCEVTIDIVSEKEEVEKEESKPTLSTKGETPTPTP